MSANDCFCSFFLMALITTRFFSVQVETEMIEEEERS